MKKEPLEGTTGEQALLEARAAKIAGREEIRGNAC